MKRHPFGERAAAAGEGGFTRQADRPLLVDRGGVAAGIGEPFDLPAEFRLWAEGCRPDHDDEDSRAPVLHLIGSTIASQALGQAFDEKTQGKALVAVIVTADRQKPSVP